MKVGDKVRVKDKLIGGNTYGVYFAPEMEKYRGGVYTIQDIRNKYTDQQITLLRGVDDWEWTEQMLDPETREEDIIFDRLKAEVENEV